MAASDPRPGDGMAAGRSVDDLVAWETIRTLVGFDTTSRESNLALIDWVAGRLRALGIASTFTFDDDRRKANLFATLPAQDGNVATGGIVLSGHTDVVPVDGQPWTSDPFVATVVGERVQGRGVTDMKSFSATALALVPEFLRRGLAQPLHIALSYDEEIGCIGVERLIADLVLRGVKPQGCIVGEPTGMRTIVAHKGKKSWRCRVRGHEAHSSLTPCGVNAVEIGCALVAYLTGRARAFRETGRHDPAFDVPYTTVHTGIIRGGTALNIVARDCAFDFEIRHLPGDDPDAFFRDVEAQARGLLGEMQAVAPEAYIAFDLLSTMPGFETEPDSFVAALGRDCSGRRDVGKVSFGTEASRYHQAAMPAIICGPGHVAQAHQPDEWVSIAQLAACEDFMRRLADRVCCA